MPIEILHSDKSLLKIAFSGRLDTNTVAHEAVPFYALLEDRKSPVILDFEQVTFLSSLGIRMVLTAAKETQRNGYDLKIEKVPPVIHEVFRMAGLTNLIR
jgi:anti-anti-sigma factor